MSLTRWSSVDDEGRYLVESLGGRWTAAGGLCRCPAHEDRRPSLSIRPGRTRLLLHCFAGCAPKDILRAFAERRLLTPGAAARAIDPIVDADLGPAARRLWGSARAVGGTPAEAYFATRGLDADEGELRYHPRTPHGPKPFTVFRPAFIAAVRDNRGLIAVHRSFLAPRGASLADMPEPRCGLGRFGRGAVRLGRAGTRLGLAEGIETARSASVLFKVAVWATLGTERFAMVELPPGVTELLLFLDNDTGGRRAEALARKAFGTLVRIETHIPNRSGDDWNDVLLADLGTSPASERGGGG